MTYFVPLNPGGRRTYNNTYTCCHGTCMEDHSKYQEQIYSHAADGSMLYVNLYIASTLNWADKGFTVAQATHYPYEPSSKLTLTGSGPLKIALRIPAWDQGARILVNVAEQTIDAKPGSYAVVDRTWASGDTLAVRFTFGFRVEKTPDDATLGAILYGPTVLAATSSMTSTITLLGLRVDPTVIHIDATPLQSVNSGDIMDYHPLRRMLPVALLAALACCFCPRAHAQSTQYVSFDDIAPAYLTLTQSWNALGTDDAGRIYIIWTSTRNDGREDAALFRYTPETTERKFLGTFIDVATRQQNIRQGEQIPKGHTRIVQVGRKLYMGSQGFHDFKDGIETLPDYRGAHLFAYDLDTGAFDDLARNLPGGVVIEHQGIVALSYSPEHNLLVGLAHPLGDLVLFALATLTVRKVVPGIPWQSHRYVSREIVVTRKGKVYTYRGPEEPGYRSTTNEVWAYDIGTDTMTRTGQRLKTGFWNGQAQTQDRSRFYLSTVSGQLYVLDVDSERFTDLGMFIDPYDYRGYRHYRIQDLYGISLTAAEDEILGVPLITSNYGNGSDRTRLVVYDVARRTFSKRNDMARSVFTGSNHRDHAGRIYMAAFDGGANCYLAVITP